MKRMYVISMIGLVFFSNGLQASPKQAMLQFEIYRIYGSISGSTSLTENVWSELEKDNPHSKNFPFSVFTLADQTLGGVMFKADTESWTWDGEEELPKDKKVKKIAAPNLVVNLDQQFELSVRSKTTMEFFKITKNDLYERKTVALTPGLSVLGTVQSTGGDNPKVILRDLAFQVRIIGKRKSVEGTTLDVGEPTVTEKKVITTLCMSSGKFYGMKVNIRDGKGFLLCRIRVDFSNESAQSSSSDPQNLEGSMENPVVWSKSQAR